VIPTRVEAGDQTGRGLLLVAAAAAFWSSGGLIVRSLDTTDPWKIIFWRSVFACLFLVGYVIARERDRTLAAFASMGPAGLLLSLCFALASISFVIALGLTSVANTLVILSTAPFVAALLSRFVLGEAIRSRTWVAMLVALVGVSIMVSDSFGESSLRGNLVACVMPLAFALGTVVIRRQRHLQMTPALALSPLIAVVVAAPLATSLRVSGRDLVLLAVFGCVQLGTGLAIYAVGARLAPPAKVALVSMLETVLGPLWVWLFVAEVPGVAAIAGGSIVLVALAAHTVVDLRRPLPPIA
jgi:drug/metabolite transporter (DMT)-like permease